MSEPSVELWGFPTEDVEGVREEVERLLGVVFALHESETIGPYYFAPLDEPESELILRPNLGADFDEEADDLESAADGSERRLFVRRLDFEVWHSKDPAR
mgnify:CR=1 FL=1